MRAVALMTALILLLCTSGFADGAENTKPASAKTAAPTFTLLDVSGKSHSISEFRGRPVTLLFFCGCDWCKRLARTWGDAQRGGLGAVDASKAPMTVVIFSGDAGGLKQFAEQYGLEKDNTVLLPDPSMQVATKYRADVCPRVFVLDTAGIIRYTNDHPDDAPRRASATVIVSKAISAISAVAKSSTKQPKAAVNGSPNGAR